MPITLILKVRTKPLAVGRVSVAATVSFYLLLAIPDKILSCVNLKLLPTTKPVHFQTKVSLNVQKVI